VKRGKTTIALSYEIEYLCEKLSERVHDPRVTVLAGDTREHARGLIRVIRESALALRATLYRNQPVTPLVLSGEDAAS